MGVRYIVAAVHVGHGVPGCRYRDVDETRAVR